jgi:hypothetical protein
VVADVLPSGRRQDRQATVHIGECATIGSGAFVLYDSHVGAGTSLGDLSLCMKGEALLPGHRYRGLPAENVEEPQRALGAKAD